MFGKPEWFRDKTFGWGLTPIAWQGWVYTAGWMGAIIGPFLLLLGRDQALEAGVWMTSLIGLLFYDVWDIKRRRREVEKPATQPVHYIGDDTDSETLDTRNFKMQVKR